MRIKKLVLFFIISRVVMAIATEENANLDLLLQKGLLSKEDYSILKAEQLGEEEEIYYTLRINGTEKNKFYPLLKKRREVYLSLNEFFKSIGIENFKKNNKIEITIGENVRKIEIDLASSEIKEDSKIIQWKSNPLIVKDEDIYLREDFFRRLFLFDIRIDELQSKIYMSLNFATPQEILKRLDLKSDALSFRNRSGEIVYESERKPFELGYTRVQLSAIKSKKKNEEMKNDWNGQLNYQGGLLYGQLQAQYDMKEKKVGDISLEYNEIWKKHTLQIENTRSGNEREWGFNFFKDKSYYFDDKKVIIRESVPIGSRVELRYMGASVAIQNEENGVVVFDNPIIVTDRTYTLIVYTPQGEIYEKEIKTTEDFNLQNKGEFQYTIRTKENRNYGGKYTNNSTVYYGVTDKLTLGFGYNRGIENINNKNKYVQDGSLSLVYGGAYNGLSYTFSLTGTKSFDDYEVDGRSYKDKYSYNGITQLGYKNLRYTYSRDEYGKFNITTKSKESHEFQYDLTKNIRLNYTYNIEDMINEKDKKTSEYGVSYDKSIGKVLLSLDANKDTNDKMSYSLNTYYTTRKNMNIRWENKFGESRKDYETNISLYNNNFKGMVDYTLEAGYSERYKEKVTFRFSLNLWNLFTMDSSIDKEGNQNYSVGIDRIIDLRNPLETIDTMDISRVKVIAFVDQNNNNILDKNEKLAEGIDITLGGKTITTDKNGEGMFYGVSNGVVHNLRTEIKQPAFSLGESKYGVKGTFTSTINAYIPIKPMLNLTGKIYIDKDLKLSDIEIEELYQDILVEIKDLDGKSLELTLPDNQGNFDVSGLYPESYTIEVSYLGNKYDLPKLSEIFRLAYIEDSFENAVAFKVNKKNIERVKSQGGE